MRGGLTVFGRQFLDKNDLCNMRTPLFFSSGDFRGSNTLYPMQNKNFRKHFEIIYSAALKTQSFMWYLTGTVQMFWNLLSADQE